MLKKLNKYLLLILVLGLGLRLYGITHGFPFIYHVDEPALQRSSYNLRFNPNPGHFDWPHFHFYLNFTLYFMLYVFRGALQVLGLKAFVVSLAPVIWNDSLIFFLISRIFNAFLGALTAIPVYLVGKRLFSERAGLIAALAMSLIPFHVHASHYALIDVPMTFWFALSLYASSMVVQSGRTKWYVLAGLFTGLAASTKYNGGFGIAVIAAAYLVHLYQDGKLPIKGRVISIKPYFLSQTKNLCMAIVAAFIFFFVGTPFAALDFDTFRRTDGPKGAFWQFTNVGKVSLQDYFPQAFDALTTRFAKDFGFAFLIVFELAFVYLLFAKDKHRLAFILLPAMFYVLYVSGFERNRIHYYMLALPLISLAVGYIMDKIAALPFPPVARRVKLRRLILVIVFLAVFLPPFSVSLADSFQLSMKDTRNIAFDWLGVNIPKYSIVYYSGSDLEVMMIETPFKLKKVSSVLSIGSSKDADYAVVSSRDSLRDKSDFDKVKDRLDLLYYVDSKGRMGPRVYIYAVKVRKQ